MDHAEREASRLDEIVIAYTANPSLGSVDDVLDVSSFIRMSPGLVILNVGSVRRTPSMLRTRLHS